MFGKQKKASEPVFDVTKKIAKTWWGGTKLIPTTKSEKNESENSARTSECHRPR